MEKSARDKDLPTPIITEFMNVLDQVEKKKVNVMQSRDIHDKRSKNKNGYFFLPFFSLSVSSVGGFDRKWNLSESSPQCLEQL